ncbi:MAG: N4-gp56 family major capsid protein [Oscillospiraceae bacterium]|nr:N4-gp56 family major capsid protein [Oscillospiraceae bacterium]
MSTQTYSSLNGEQKSFYEKALMRRMVPNLVYAKYGQHRSAPKNEGDTMNFRRFGSLAAATTALTEGVTPSGSDLAVTSVTATVKQYGDFVEISDKLDMVGVDPVLAESAGVLGEQAALTIDTIVRDEVTSGTSVVYAGGRANRDALTAADVVTSNDIRKAVRTLKRNNAKPMEGGFYIGIIHPDVAYDVMNDSMWQDISKYSGGTQIMKGEIGKIHGVRFLESTNNKTVENSGGVGVHLSMIIGQDAYGVVDVAGRSKPEMIVKSAGSSGTADPLNQRATSGWKALFTAKRLQELAMVRLESAATA